jgi:hypothetical protein
MMIHLTLHWRTPTWGLRHQLMMVLWVTLLVLAMGSCAGYLPYPSRKHEAG